MSFLIIFYLFTYHLKDGRLYVISDKSAFNRPSPDAGTCSRRKCRFAYPIRHLRAFFLVLISNIAIFIWIIAPFRPPAEKCSDRVLYNGMRLIWDSSLFSMFLLLYENKWFKGFCYSDLLILWYQIESISRNFKRKELERCFLPGKNESCC